METRIIDSYLNRWLCWNNSWTMSLKIKPAHAVSQWHAMNFNGLSSLNINTRPLIIAIQSCVSLTLLQLAKC